MRAKKSLGQNFLKNKEVLQKITEAIDINENDTVVEVGPGHGELTDFLINKYPKSLIIIEKDEQLASLLRQKLNNIQIIAGDALQELNQLKLPTNWKLVGNIPYYITGRLLRVISELPNPPLKSVIMVQKEVAERISAQAPRANLLSSITRGWAIPKYLFTVYRSNFNPIPQVDSAVISLEKKELACSLEYFSTVRALFSQPRKKAINNFYTSLNISKEEVKTFFTSCNIPHNARPQNLTEDKILCLLKLINDPSRSVLAEADPSR